MHMLITQEGLPRTNITIKSKLASCYVTHLITQQITAHFKISLSLDKTQMNQFKFLCSTDEIGIL